MALIKGTKYRDQIHATGNNDSVYGYDGNDDLYGGFNNDLLVGGNGNDKLYGEGGNDTLDSGAGNDTLDGGAGFDNLKGGAGNDTYVLGSGIDKVTDTGGIDTITTYIGRSLIDTGTIERLTLLGDLNVSATGNSLANILIGNTGDNTLDGGSGADILQGGLGDDTYILANGTDVVSDTGGHDTIISTIARSLVAYATIEDLTLTGTNHVNATGNGLANVITGNAGNNILDGGGGTDHLRGGLGNDTYVMTNTNDFVSDDGGTDTITSTITRTLVSYDDIEGLTLLGTANINGTGNTRSNTITGNSGNNTLEGGAGVDTLIGGNGNDTYIVDTVNLIDHAGDALVETATGGTDTVRSSVDYTLFANLEILIMTGTADTDATGNELGNSITGNGGANLIDGGMGVDSMSGGLGNDTYVVDVAGDTITEAFNAGIDEVQSSLSWTLGANIEDLVLTGSADLNGTGNSLDNLLEGNTGTNTLTGLAGDDSYFVDSTSDVVVEAANEGTDLVQSVADYTLSANVEALELQGTEDINGTGNALDNTLNGNSGVNTLAGLGGHDLLTGNAGIDLFVLSSTAANADTVTDFVQGTDTLMFEDTIVVGTSSDLVNTMTYVTGVYTASAELVFEKSTGNLYFDADGSGAIAGYVVATLTGVTADLSTGDFATSVYF